VNVSEARKTRFLPSFRDFAPAKRHKRAVPPPPCAAHELPGTTARIGRVMVAARAPGQTAEWHVRVTREKTSLPIGVLHDKHLFAKIPKTRATPGFVISIQTKSRL